MLNFLTIFGADSEFEKNRILLTKPIYEAPNQQALRNILHSFAGQDEQTRSQIAFATMVKKIHISSAKQNWVYLLKNLIILDRVAGDNRFCEELAQTNLQTIEDYSEKDGISEAVNARFLLKTYWQLIQDICRLKISRKYILYYKRSQRKAFLESLKTSQLLSQIKVLQKLFDNCLSLIFLTSSNSNMRQRSEQLTQVPNEKSHKYYLEFVNSSLAEYLNIHIYSKLLTLFSCQYLCIHKFIQVILHTTKTQQHILVSIEEARLFKKMVFRFKANCMEMMSLVQRNKAKKGFQNIDTKQFNAFSEQHIIKAIDQYINQHTTQQKISIIDGVQIFSTRSSLYLNNPTQRFVDKKPLILRNLANEAQISPRKLINLKNQQQEQDAFEDYFNSYSDEFPHKNLMTIDLIEDIRRDEEKMYKQIMDSVELEYLLRRKNQQIKHNDINTNEQDFFKQFKKLKSKVKFQELVIFDKEEKQKEQQSTNYSFKNSSREGSLFDVLNLKWILPQSQV